MRKKGKLIFWPAYFDSEFSWTEGRRVSKKLALRGVKADEVLKAAEDLDLGPLLEPGAAHPKRPWLRSGLVLVNKKGTKSELLKETAQRIRVNRARK
jgi:signal recognition particle subunit SRP19